MTWSNNLAVGIPMIDQQHKELCDRIDSLFDACSKRKGGEEALKMLTFLEDYTIKHFTDEQNLHQQLKYPKATEHKAMHDAFIAQLKKLKAEIDTSDVSVDKVVAINQMVSSWLINHIMKFDRELKEYYK